MVNSGQSKNPVVAAILSFFIPGLGQVYDGGGYLKGLMYLVATVIGYIILVVPGLIIWLYCIYNAYSVAKKVNSGLIPYKHVGAGSLIIFAIIGFVLVFVGIFLFVIVISAVIAAFVFAIGGTSSY